MFTHSFCAGMFCTGMRFVAKTRTSSLTRRYAVCPHSQTIGRYASLHVAVYYSITATTAQNGLVFNITALVYTVIK